MKKKCPLNFLSEYYRRTPVSYFCPGCVYLVFSLPFRYSNGYRLGEVLLSCERVEEAASKSQSLSILSKQRVRDVSFLCRRWVFHVAALLTF